MAATRDPSGGACIGTTTVPGAAAVGSVCVPIGRRRTAQNAKTRRLFVFAAAGRARRRTDTRTAVQLRQRREVVARFRPPRFLFRFSRHVARTVPVFRVRRENPIRLRLPRARHWKSIVNRVVTPHTSFIVVRFEIYITSPRRRRRPNRRGPARRRGRPPSPPTWDPIMIVVW